MLKLTIFLILLNQISSNISVNRYKRRYEEVILSKNIEPMHKNLYQKYQNFNYFFQKVLEKEIHLSRTNQFPEISQKKLLKNIKYDKEIPKDLTGLHREIEYNFSFEIKKENYNLEKLKNKICFISFLDYCDFNFYIDYEEIEMTENFNYYENERMNIEKINEDAKQYFYMLQLRVLEQNFKIEKDKILFNFQKKIPYHLRYGKAHEYGFSNHKLGRNFDVILNCVKTNNNFEFLTNSLKNQYALHVMNYKENDLFYYMLDEYKSPLDHFIPVVKPDSGFIKFSTLFFVLMGMVLLMKDILRVKS